MAYFTMNLRASSRQTPIFATPSSPDFPTHLSYSSLATRRVIERPWVNFQSIGRVRSKLPN